MDRSRRLFLMLALVAVVVLVCAGFNYLVDPYRSWGTGLIDPIFSKLSNDRIQIPYLLRSTAPETVLVGSSRVAWGINIEEGYRTGILNAGIAGATVPQVVNVIDVALQNRALKRIVWFVDFFAFSRHYQHVDPNFDARLSGSLESKLEETLLSLDAIGDSFDQLKRSLGGRQKLRRTRMVAIPWPMDFICPELDRRVNSDLSTVSDAVVIAQLTRNWYADYDPSPDLARLFSDTVRRIRARHVELVMVVAPMSQYELEVMRQSGQWEHFQDFKRMLAANGPFWDFSGYNPVARRADLFRDATHMKPAMGEMVLRIVLRMDARPCNARAASIAASGQLVDPGSVESALARQDQMLRRAIDPPSHFTEVAARARRSIADYDRELEQTRDQ
jgi:hypothetical protein